MRSNKKPNIVIIATVVALVIFIASVSIGIAIVKNNSKKGEETQITKTAEKETESDVITPIIESDVITPPEKEDEKESKEVIEEDKKEEATAPVSDPKQDTQEPQQQTQQQSQQQTQQQTQQPSSYLTGVFDKSQMGASGYSNISSYRQINPDVKGWLKIPGTNINYPVLYNAYDVNYYLEKDLYKQYSRNGVIWASPEAQFGSSSEISKNTVLYGHNWTNYSANPRIGYSSDVMFAQLTSYHYLNFAKQYPYIYYSTEDSEMTWVVFAAFYTDINFNYIACNPSDSGLTQIISGAKARSRHNFDVDVNSSDKILTMSTCTRAYGSSENQRFVVMARLLRSGEELLPITVSTNPNPVLPRL